MSEKTIAFPVWERLAHVLREEREKATVTYQAIAKTLRILFHGHCLDEWHEIEMERHLNRPDRLALLEFEKRIKAVRQGYKEPENDLERTWKRYTRKAFYVQLQLEYSRRNLFLDAKRVALESQKGSLEKRTIRDEQGHPIGSETTTDDISHPLTVDFDLNRHRKSPTPAGR